MIYLVVFAFSIFFAWQAEVKMDKNKAFRTPLCFAAICPIVLAGIRSDTVGMDIKVYVEPVFKLARASVSLANFYSRHGDGTEYGYLTYIYALTKIFDNFLVIMLLNHVIIVSACLMTIVYFKRKYNISLWFGYAIMLLHFYNPSLCLIRQSLGMSFALIGLLFLLKKRILFFVFFAVISVSIHTSMISFVSAYFFLFVVISNVKSSRYKLLALFAIFATIPFASSLMGFTMTFVDAKYASRVMGSDSNSGGLVTIALYAFYSLLPFVMYFFHGKKMHLEFFLYLPIFGLPFQILGRQTVYLTRLAVPFMAMIMLSIPYVLKKKSHQLLFTGLLLALWILNFYIRGDWGTVPYVVGNIFNG